MRFKRRSKVGRISALILALFFGALLAAISAFDLWAGGRPSDAPLPFTVRISQVGVYNDTMTAGAQFQLRSRVFARGVKLDPKSRRMLRALEASRRPPSMPLLTGLTLGFVLLLLLYSRFLSAQGGVLAYTRTQLVLLASLTLLAVAGKAILALTDMSSAWVPLSLLVFPVAALLGTRAAAATALLVALVGALLNPLDLNIVPLLLAHGLVVALIVRHHAGRGRIVAGSVVAGIAGALTFVAFTLVLHGKLELGLGTADIDALLRADIVAAGASPLLWGIFALLLTPLLERSLGKLSKSRLVALADFEHPLLKRVSTVASGTWAHSLNMANMAEMAANRIHADALLVRVAAYYHDVGKTVQPEYFIENQQGKNPHDDMSPERSADAIHAHVTEGVKLARRAGVPESIVEFIYTHHGNSLLEYFWHKALKAGNPLDLEESDFRYPGVPPQTREQGILAVTDAVEAASKTLKQPKLDQIQKLVRTIVFSKVEHGQLGESGLTIDELRIITETLIDALRSAMHVRVKYPWQEEEERAAGGGGSQPAAKAESVEPKGSPSKPRLEPVEDGAAADGEVVVELAGAAAREPAWADSRNKVARHTRPMGVPGNKPK
ncbi:MAG: HDIG domain-containing protein [Myxococcales bacterium]|nr:HDIG domain-containing protein [Myxococcales bacterium]